MSEHEEIEAAVRAYFEVPLDEVQRLAAGPLAEISRLTADLTDPIEVVEKHLAIDSLEIVRGRGRRSGGGSSRHRRVRGRDEGARPR